MEEYKKEEIGVAIEVLLKNICDNSEDALEILEYLLSAFNPKSDFIDRPAAENVPIKIKIEMVKKRVKGAAIARKVGVSRQAIYQVMKGEYKSLRIRRAIADAIGMKVGDLWPNNKHKKAA